MLRHVTVERAALDGALRRARRDRSVAFVALALAVGAGLSGPIAPIQPAQAADAAAAVCTGWASESAPPETIRVLRTQGPAVDTVQVVPFREYVDVVMGSEWGASNPAEALRAGAVAVKQYAWHRAMKWRGRAGPDGSCYDVVDTTVDQVYAPEKVRPVPPALVAAVEASWGTRVLRSEHIFATHYQAGRKVACGADADGVWLFQNSAMQCARDGLRAAEILMTYYGPDATVTGAGDPTDPSPSPGVSPSPSQSPSPGATPSPSPGLTPGPSPTASPAPATALTLAASTSGVKWSRPIRLTAMLTVPAGVSRDGLTVRFESSPDGAEWTLIGTAPTSAAGKATYTYRPVGNLRYRAAFDGVTGIPAVTSEQLRVSVRQWVTFTTSWHGSSSAVPRGRKVTFSVVVRPARADAPPGRVTLEATRLVGGQWRRMSVRSAQPDAQGRAAFSVTFTEPGEWRVRVRAAATRRNAASDWVPAGTYKVR